MVNALADLVSMSVLLAAVLVPLYAVFLHRIQLHPIRGRIPLLSVYASGSYAVAMLVLLAQNLAPERWACWTRSIVILGIIPMFEVCIVRSTFLILSLRLASALVKSKNLKDLSPFYTWLSNKRWLLKTKYVIITSLLLLLVLYVPVLYYFLNIEVSRKPESLASLECQCEGALCVVPTVALFLCVCILFLIFIGIYNAEDNLHIRTELRMFIAGNFFFTVVFGVNTLRQNEAIEMLLRYATILAAHAVLLGYPVYASFNHAKASRPRATSAMSSPTSRFMVEFLGVIQSKAGYNAFEAFLIKEFSVENLLGWKSVNELKTKYVDSEDPYDAIELESKVVLLIESYLLIGAPLEVNIKTKLKKVAETLLHNIRISDHSTGTIAYDVNELHELLSNVEQELVNLMRDDAFVRFRKSPEYQNLFELAEKPSRVSVAERPAKLSIATPSNH